MLRFLIVLSFLLLIFWITIGIYQVQAGDPRAEAESVVRGQKNGLEATARSSANLGNKVPGFESSSPSQTGYGDGQMADDATLMMADPGTHEGGAAVLIRRSVDRRPSVTLEADDSMFDRSTLIESNPDRTLQGLLSGTYSGCSANLGSTGTGGEARFCDRYYTETEETCALGRVIQVEPQYNYECHRDRRTFTRTCIRRASVNWLEGQDEPQVTWSESCADS